MIALGELLVLHAEPPVRIADREAALGGDRVELVGVDVLEDRRVEIEPVAAGIALDLDLHRGEFRRQVGVGECGHVCNSRRAADYAACSTWKRVSVERANHVVQPRQLACQLAAGQQDRFGRIVGLARGIRGGRRGRGK